MKGTVASEALNSRPIVLKARIKKRKNKNFETMRRKRGKANKEVVEVVKAGVGRFMANRLTSDRKCLSSNNMWNDLTSLLSKRT